MKRRFTLAAACLLALCSQAAYAQFDPFKVIKNYNGTVPFTLSIADMDRDGHPDMISSGNYVVCSFNNGEGKSFTNVDLPNSHIGPAHQVVGADLDNDGHGDVLASFYVGNYNYKLMVWYGQPNKTFSNPSTLLSSFPSGNFSVQDLTKNGLPDIVIPDGGHAVDPEKYNAMWLRNQGRSSWTQIGLPPLPNSTDLQFVDFNGDGQLEALVLRYTVQLYSGANFGTKTELLPSQDFEMDIKLRVLDMDGDGDLDIVGLKYHGEGMVWFENKGNLQFTPHHISSEGRSYRSFVAGDLDGDGDADLVAGCWTTCNLTYFENVGEGKFVRSEIGSYTSAIGGFEEMKLSDVDSDGMLDIVITDGRERALTWLRNLNAPLVTGIADGLAAGVKLFPNPSTGKFTITSEESPITRLLLYDAMGKLMMETSNPTRQQEIELNLEQRPRGMYQLLLYTDSGQPIHKKLVLQ